MYKNLRPSQALTMESLSRMRDRLWERKGKEKGRNDKQDGRGPKVGFSFRRALEQHKSGLISLYLNDDGEK